MPAIYITTELWIRIVGGNMDDTYTIPLCLTAIALLCVLTEINFRWVEIPCRRKGTAIANRMMAEKTVPKAVRVFHRNG